MKTSSRLTTILPFAALLALVLGALICTGCQTMKGAGKDIENAGEGIQKAAK